MAVTIETIEVEAQQPSYFLHEANKILDASEHLDRIMSHSLSKSSG